MRVLASKKQPFSASKIFSLSGYCPVWKALDGVFFGGQHRRASHRRSGGWFEGRAEEHGELASKRGSASNQNRMKYFVMLGDERKGPYTLGQMQAMWNAGTLTLETLHWREGLADWEPLSTIAADLDARGAPVLPPVITTPDQALPPNHTNPAAQEASLYADDNVVVTTTRISIRGTTYALRNIGSVKKGFSPINPTVCVLTITAVEGCVLLIGFQAQAHEVYWLSGLCLLGFICWLGVAIAWWRRLKPDYHVVILSTSGEINSLTSKNEAYVQRIVSSINDAIVRYR